MTAEASITYLETVKASRARTKCDESAFPKSENPMDSCILRCARAKGPLSRTHAGCLLAFKIGFGELGYSHKKNNFSSISRLLFAPASVIAGSGIDTAFKLLPLEPRLPPVSKMASRRPS